jgi:hypothetical protein
MDGPICIWLTRGTLPLMLGGAAETHGVSSKTLGSALFPLPHGLPESFPLTATTPLQIRSVRTADVPKPNSVAA